MRAGKTFLEAWRLRRCDSARARVSASAHACAARTQGAGLQQLRHLGQHFWLCHSGCVVQNAGFAAVPRYLDVAKPVGALAEDVQRGWRPRVRRWVATAYANRLIEMQVADHAEQSSLSQRCQRLRGPQRQLWRVPPLLCEHLSVLQSMLLVNACDQLVLHHQMVVLQQREQTDGIVSTRVLRKLAGPKLGRCVVPWRDLDMRTDWGGR